jgi:hypothetical protein
VRTSLFGVAREIIARSGGIQAYSSRPYDTVAPILARVVPPRVGLGLPRRLQRPGGPTTQFGRVEHLRRLIGGPSPPMAKAECQWSTKAYQRPKRRY